MLSSRVCEGPIVVIANLGSGSSNGPTAFLRPGSLAAMMGFFFRAEVM